jgi:hypothetical protein
LRPQVRAGRSYNEEKSRIVDLGRGESFGFLGFDFRRIRSGRGVFTSGEQEFDNLTTRGVGERMRSAWAHQFAE